MPASMPSSRPCARNWPNDVRAEAWDEPVARHTMRRGLNRSSSEVIRRLDTAQLGAAGVAKALDRAPAAVDAEVHRRVEEILAAVREKGDAALLDFTERFHRECAPRSWRMTDALGSRLGQEVRPLDRVAVYVPGGRAAYPSTVLMTVIPARVAGVREIVLVSPPRRDKSLDPAVLAAARVAGITEAYRVGGAQAVAALAYGTETIRRVDKIVGPGNIYVALA